MLRWLLILAFALGAQDTHQDPPKGRAKIPPEIRPVVELARAAPPEFAANAILRLLEAGKIPGRDLGRELIEEAFTLTGRAQQPLRRVALPGTPDDTRARYLGKAFELRLDAMSLETRAIKAMLNVDRKAAREMLERVTLPSLAAPPCEEPLTFGAPAIYGVLGPIAQSAFSDEEKKNEEHVRFLLAWLARITSPVELAPFADALLENLSPEEWELVVGSFSAKLESIGPDYRAFAMSIEPLRDQIMTMAARGVAVPALRRAFRRYLVTQLRAPRCAEDLPGPAQAVEWFNTSFRGELPVIAEDEMQPEKRGATLKAEPYFKSGESERLAQAFEKVRFNTGVGPWSEVERRTAQWKSLVADFLRDLADWRASQEQSEIDYFHQKAMVLRGLIELTPAGEERDKLLGQYVEFVQNSSVEQQSPIEWFWHAQEVRRFDPAKTLAAFRSSGNVVLALEATLAELIPQGLSSGISK